MNHRPLHVLIIDDSPEDRETSKRLLRKAHTGRILFAEAEEGEEGLRLAQEAPPDCILLDYDLPDLTGLEFLERLPRPTGRCAIATVMLTGQGDESLAVQAMKRGCQDYIAKSTLTPEAVHRAVSNAIEKVRLQCRIEDQQRELEEFTYSVSHDLKAPVVSIQGFVNLLIRDEQESLSDPARQYLSRILANCERMESLLADLLELSRIGRIEEDWKELDLRKAVEQIFANLAPHALEKGITLRTEGAWPTVMVRQRRIIQAFTNLIDNAIKYMPDKEGGLVAVGFDPDARDSSRNRGAFYVRDNGLGIPPRSHRRIFEVFQRGQSPPAGTEGTGIGLSIVKRVAATHGGETWVESEAGKGATFFITLPLAEPIPATV